jgi:tRNA (guanine-N7-)-methyltransferase
LYAVEFLLPPASIETFYLLFPDPWPKRRHHRRRLVSEHFLEAVSAALEPNGLLRVATDQSDYFEQIHELAKESPGFEMLKDASLETLPETKFEKRFKREGAEIYRLALRKISPVT